MLIPGTLSFFTAIHDTNTLSKRTESNNNNAKRLQKATAEKKTRRRKNVRKPSFSKTNASVLNRHTPVCVCRNVSSLLSSS